MLDSLLLNLGRLFQRRLALSLVPLRLLHWHFLMLDSLLLNLGRLYWQPLVL